MGISIIYTGLSIVILYTYILYIYIHMVCTVYTKLNLRSPPRKPKKWMTSSYINRLPLRSMAIHFLRFGWSHHWQLGWGSRHGPLRATKTSGRHGRRSAAQHSRISGDIDLQFGTDGIDEMEIPVGDSIQIGDSMWDGFCFCFEIPVIWKGSIIWKMWW